MKIQKLNKWTSYENSHDNHIEYVCSILHDQIKYIVFFLSTDVDNAIRLQQRSEDVEFKVVTEKIFHADINTQSQFKLSNEIVTKEQNIILNIYTDKLIEEIIKRGIDGYSYRI